jgi:7-methyl-GTP pyrophosphatase
MAQKRLVLASTSPYRRKLLARLGLEFDVHAPGVDETERAGESADGLAARLAAAKADSVAAPDAIVIGSDQVASLDGRILRKPESHARALAQLVDCQGRDVVFATAAVVIDRAGGRRWQTIDRTTVSFARRDRAALDRYLRRAEPYDCAGGFKAEGLGIALFTKIESADPTALIGLPLIWIAAALTKAGLDPLSEPADDR